MRASSCLIGGKDDLAGQHSVAGRKYIRRRGKGFTDRQRRRHHSSCPWAARGISDIQFERPRARSEVIYGRLAAGSD